MISLLDIFMPEDMCARCGEEEPVRELSVDIYVGGEHQQRAKLHFCSYRCQDLFVRGAHAVKEVEDVL